MKVSVNYILSANKQKKYIQLTKFYGYKYVNGVRKQDKSRENLGWIWATPKNTKQRDFNKQRRADVPVELIMRLAGHSDYKTTFKYIQLVDEDKQPAIKALSDIYNR